MHLGELFDSRCFVAISNLLSLTLFSAKSVFSKFRVHKEMFFFQVCEHYEQNEHYEHYKHYEHYEHYEQT